MECSVWTKRRRINAKVQDHLRLLEILQSDASSNEDVVAFETDSNRFENPNEQLMSHTACDTMESQVDGNLNEELDCHAERDQDEERDKGSDSEERDQDSDSEEMWQTSDSEERDQESDNETKTDIVEGSNPCSELRGKLADWAAKRNISHSALSELLTILKQCGLDLPKDPRTLLSTLKNCEVKAMGDGSYYYFGIANAISSELSRESPPVVDTLTLRVNIDGLSLSKSSKNELWPILAKIKEIPTSEVFIIGLYAGKSKPPSVEEYLKDFVQDLKLVTSEGLDYNGKHYNVALPDAFICDAPARAFLKGIKGHSGYSSCERCVVHGVYLNSKVVFPDLNEPLRTDLTFERRCDEEHHQSVSPLQELGIGMVSSFVLDYMHLVCLGNVRRVISLWILGPLKCRLSSSTITAISSHLESIREYIPRNFSRKPRSLREFKQWKATEFRQFLLYTGPVVLKGRLPARLYKNFMLLSIAMRILLSPALCSDYCDYADKLLKCYVQNFAKLYGPEQVVYNTHSLIHLADDARRFGALDSVSCFPFENHLGTLSKLVRRPQGPVQQLVRRVGERNRPFSREERKNGPQGPHLCGPTLPHVMARKQYKKYRLNGQMISCSHGSNSYSVDGKVAVLKNIIEVSTGDIYAVCQFFEKQECFYRYPLDSSLVGISMVSKLSEELRGVAMTDLTEKLVLLPVQEGNVAFIQLHDL